MDDLTSEKIDEYFKDKERKKKYLKRYKKNRACVYRLYDKLDLITSKLDSIGSPSLSEMPKGGIRKSTADMINEKIDIERRIPKLEKSGAILKENTYDLIDQILDPKLVEIMELLFIKCYEMEEVANILGMSKRQLLRNYRLAIDSIELDKED